jgi:hypothetical protein
MTTLYKYKYRCIEEGIDVGSWGKTPPTICINDHVDRTIDLNSIAIVEQFIKQHVTIDENTNGFFETDMIVNDVGVGATGSVSTFDVIWDSNITLWRTVLSCSNEMIGDELKVVAVPETPIGLITNPVSISDTVITVDNDVIANAYRGFECVIDDTTNKHVTVIKAIDTINNTITLKHASPYAYSASAPIKIGIFIVKYAKIHNALNIDIGIKGVKGKAIEQGKVVRITYTNNNGQAKKVYWRTEYYNDG